MPRYSGVTMTRLVAGVDQRPAQRAHHVRQAARFGERIDFAAGEQEFSWIHEFTIHDHASPRPEDAQCITRVIVN